MRFRRAHPRYRSSHESPYFSNLRCQSMLAVIVEALYLVAFLSQHDRFRLKDQ